MFDTSYSLLLVLMFIWREKSRTINIFFGFLDSKLKVPQNPLEPATYILVCLRWISSLIHVHFISYISLPSFSKFLLPILLTCNFGKNTKLSGKIPRGYTFPKLEKNQEYTQYEEQE